VVRACAVPAAVVMLSGRPRASFVRLVTTPVQSVVLLR